MISAESALKKLVTFLQNKREQDFWDTFKFDLENGAEDPAETDFELSEKLRINKVKGDKKLNEVFEKFVKKQKGFERSQEDLEKIDIDSEKRDELCCVIY